MADEPDLGKVEALKAEITNLQAQIQAQREAAIQRDQEIAALHEQLSARDRKIAALEAGIGEPEAENVKLHALLAARDRDNASLSEWANRGWARVAELDKRDRARADQAASVAVHDLASTAGLRGHDGGSLPQNTIDAFRSLIRWVAGNVPVNVQSELWDACCVLRRALDEGHPSSDVITAAMVVAFHWDELSRDRTSRQAGRLQRDYRTLHQFFRETPKRLGSGKKGWTKRDPAKVAAYFEDLIKSGTRKQVARVMTREKFEISAKTLRGYLRMNCKS